MISILREIIYEDIIECLLCNRKDKLKKFHTCIKCKEEFICDTCIVDNKCYQCNADSMPPLKLPPCGHADVMVNEH